MKAFVSTSVYGFCNYALALLMIGSPWLFGFSHAHGASLLLPLYFGWLQLIMAIFGRHALGFIKVFPVSMHCFIDVMVGSFLLGSPFIYGYYHTGVWIPQFLLGLALFLLGLFTKQSPFTDEPRHVFKDGLMEHIGDIDEPMSH
ncbi:SPW repeat domain-containing protein [Mucilaginibacter sp.]|jgi:hypothetical protein|uniref:SPW repeat domain-containing protein n=1 Tax=Mucilaginibacter sp. TaxID=1882438 RepID=UPI002D002412|nr:hypothetical protein [Mucilaginibacter sp.]HTI57576.1 hypothetical protein [Mucilaginibacter sp.]